MNKKLFVFDFDGTIVTEDILDEVCDIVGKEELSKEINEYFVTNAKETGVNRSLSGLCTRINFLNGVSTKQIKEKLDCNNYLRKGTKELFEYLNKNNFITILASGNIVPILNYYKDLLNIDYVIGTSPRMNGDKIDYIDTGYFSSSSFKYDSVVKLVTDLNIAKENIYGIGDSIFDKETLGLCGHSFAVNPSGGIENYVDVVINDDLSKVIDYIK